MRSISIPLVALALVVLPHHAQAQDACVCARSVCETVRASQNRSSWSCDGMASLPPSQCTDVAQDLVARLRATGRAAPASCQGIGAAVVIEGVAPTTVVPDNTGPRLSRPPLEARPPADRAPTRLTPDPAVPVASRGGRLACELDHDAPRVVVAGAPVTFSVQCAGIPLPNNPRGTAERTPPPYRTADGRIVDISWSITSGTIAPDLLSAGWVAPTAPENAGDVRVRATVTLSDGQRRGSESVVLTRTIHVVPRELTLELTSHEAARCGDREAPSAAAYDVECRSTLLLTVSDNLRVTGREGTACAAPRVTNLHACDASGPPAFAPPSLSLTSARGRIDPTTGVLRLDVDGSTFAARRASIAGSRRAVARAARRDHRASDFLPRTLELAPDHGAVRSFGAFDPRTGAGARETFTLRSH